MEAQALKKEQERSKEDMKERHRQERDELSSQIEADARKQEADLVKETETEKERLLREKKNKQAAELAARRDLTSEELAAVSSSRCIYFRIFFKAFVGPRSIL